MRDNATRQLDTPWLTAQQAADHLQVALGTIRNWTSAKFVPHAKRRGLVRYHRERLDRWLRTRECRGRATFADVPSTATVPDTSEPTDGGNQETGGST